jgi:predicted component of type VI protein secretion system
MSPNRRLVLPLLAALALGLLVVGVSACGYSSSSKDVSEGEPVTLGDLQFNVTFSRFLNPSDNEDSAYLVGQPAPPAGSTYFGIFLEIQNESEEAQTLPSTLKITDATGETYDVIPSESLYALEFGGEVESQEQIPVLDSTPQQGAIEGSLALFLLPAEASSNRPLTLHIPGADGEDAEVKIDL